MHRDFKPNVRRGDPGQEAELDGAETSAVGTAWRELDRNLAEMTRTSIHVGGMTAPGGPPAVARGAATGLLSGVRADPADDVGAAL